MRNPFPEYDLDKINEEAEKHIKQYEKNLNNIIYNYGENITTVTETLAGLTKCESSRTVRDYANNAKSISLIRALKICLAFKLSIDDFINKDLFEESAHSDDTLNEDSGDVSDEYLKGFDKDINLKTMIFTFIRLLDVLNITPQCNNNIITVEITDDYICKLIGALSVAKDDKEIDLQVDNLCKHINSEFHQFGDQLLSPSKYQKILNLLEYNWEIKNSIENYYCEEFSEDELKTIEKLDDDYKRNFSEASPQEKKEMFDNLQSFIEKYKYVLDD